MSDYGDVVLRTEADGRVTVVEAADRIGVAFSMFDHYWDPSAVWVTENGCLGIGSDALHFYKPVAISEDHHFLILERVQS